MIIKLIVEPKLPPKNRKALSSYVQTLKRERPSYITDGYTFMWCGSVVTIKILPNTKD